MRVVLFLSGLVAKAAAFVPRGRLSTERPLFIFSAERCRSVPIWARALHSGLFSTKTDASEAEEVYHPPQEYLNSREQHLEHVDHYRQLYEESIRKPHVFWGGIARELYWHKPFDRERVVEYNFDRTEGPIFVKWFEGGLTNICYNCLDRHVQAGHGNRIAFYMERNEEDHVPLRHPHNYTYARALDEVSRLANALKSMGVSKGDKVGIFMPMVAELPLAMLACARIGAVHTVVFAGFSKDGLAGRLVDSGAKVVITCDGVFRGTKPINLFETVEEALEVCTSQGHDIRSTIVLERVGPEVSKIQLKPGRDIHWHEATAAASSDCPPEWVDAEDPLFILYTSGSTGKPKGVLHTSGGYMVGAATTFKYVFNVRPDQNDVWFSTADCGWITGHSYGTYGPLLEGASTVVFEGVPSFPDHGRLWRIVDKYNVTHLYTAPTAIRALMREGDQWVKQSSRRSLKVLGTVGEPINPEAWKWYFDVVGEKRCPIADTWWQTETGSIAISPLAVRGWVQKPGSATMPFFGIEPVLLSPEGTELEGVAEGLLAIKSPWPSSMRTIHGNHARMEETYFSFPGYYLTGDNARRDQDGYFTITGRADDVVIVSGHNLGTAEVESALASHPAVAEAAVVGVPHDLKGNALHCFVTLNAGVGASNDIATELRTLVRNQLGAFAAPDFIQWSPRLPKTRSGKIMRRILRKIAAAGKDVKMGDLGDVSTLAEPDVIHELVASHHTAPGEISK